MMNDRPPHRQVPPVAAGLCEACAHVQVISTAKGSSFILCRRSHADPRFPRYPRLPVTSCEGFGPRSPDGPPRR